MGRRVLVTGVAVALLVGAVVVAWVRVAGDRCGAGVESAEPRNPLMSTRLMDERPDEHRDVLRAAVASMGAPFGEPVAGVGYYYDQWLQLYGVPGGLLAWTKRNAPVTMLAGKSLEPAWSLRPATTRTAWDASADTFLLAQLSDEPTELVAFDLDSGEQRWCATLPDAQPEGAPLTTTFVDDGVVAASVVDGRVTVTRVDAEGEQQWSTGLAADRADWVGSFGGHLVVGGREEYHLASGEHELPEVALAALDPDDGSTRWRYRPLGGAAVHVLGVRGDQLLLLEHTDRPALTALDDEGRRQWSVDLPPTALQATLRGDVVLLKSKDRLLGRSAADGRALWQRPIPPTFTPYGFRLAQMPQLDERTLLLPTTDELRLLDVRRGTHRALAMPTDGINTTYWPYQLVATDDLLGVVTNTGAVVARRTS